LVAYIDYAKAFDVVSHAKLLAKLTAYSCTSGNLLIPIDLNFLAHRTQQTKVGTAMSKVTGLISDVVQGSVIEPLSFLLFIKDVIAMLTKNEFTFQLHADDLELHSAINVDCNKNELQERLNDLKACMV
jgi:Reverse transcriptase (RNA-dependent DNA polymerase)